MLWEMFSQPPDVLASFVDFLLFSSPTHRDAFLLSWEVDSQEIYADLRDSYSVYFSPSCKYSVHIVDNLTSLNSDISL
jgi:hypothetical protein